MGVYPLLEDETCWFLAADFDKSSWGDDVAAFVETCRAVGVPVAVERSRSGNGAHVWFFFAEPVPAAIARKMGCYLITETMSRRHELSMDSYDRLFPNQDTMPRGGFGNLIALPLQHGPRQQGNSVFLDDDSSRSPETSGRTWLPCRGSSRRRVEAIAAGGDAARARSSASASPRSTDEDDAAPWTRPPSGRPRIVADRRAAARRGPRGARPAALRREGGLALAAAQPDQAARRLPEPRVLQEAEHAPLDRADAAGDRLRGGAAAPRRSAAGLPCPSSSDLLGEHGVALDSRGQAELRRRRSTSRFRGELTRVQKQAARALLAHDIGVFVAPPGVGKTVVGTYLVAERALAARSSSCTGSPLLDQWVAQLSLFLGIDAKEIGQIGGGQAQAERPARRGDDPEPRPRRTRSTTSSPATGT